MGNIKRFKKDGIRLLLIEGSTELEAGIPPNLAVLVSAVNSAGHDVMVFSTNDYRQGFSTGDSRRVNSLQVPPTDSKDMIYTVKDSDIQSDFLKAVDEYKPHVIGLSSTEATYSLGIDLLRSTAGRDDLMRIVGGAHPTIVPDEVIADDSVDAVCVGEGEKALVDLMDRISDGRIKLDGRDYDREALAIDNFQFKQPGSGEIIKNPSKLMDVNFTPFQDWSAWPIPPRASKSMRGKVSKTGLVELTRGCPYKCTYCANVLFNETFKSKRPDGKTISFYRERDVEIFIEEVVYLRNNWDIEYVYIGDETIMTTSQKRFEKFVNMYPETARDGKVTGRGLPFWCETRPESITHDRVKAFLDVGLAAINVGIESGNEEYSWEKLHRRVSNEKMIQGIVDAVRAGANIGSNVIIGFPGEDRQMIFETVELIRAAKVAAEQVGIDNVDKKISVMIHLFQPYRGTSIREEAIKIGVIAPDHICGDYRMDAIGTGILSSEELLGLQRTFNLYVDLPKSRWNEIREAESFSSKGDAKFEQLAREYQLLHFGKTSF